MRYSLYSVFSWDKRNIDILAYSQWMAANHSFSDLADARRKSRNKIIKQNLSCLIPRPWQSDTGTFGFEKHRVLILCKVAMFKVYTRGIAWILRKWKSSLYSLSLMSKKWHAQRFEWSGINFVYFQKFPAKWTCFRLALHWVLYLAPSALCPTDFPTWLSAFSQHYTTNPRLLYFATVFFGGLLYCIFVCNLLSCTSENA